MDPTPQRSVGECPERSLLIEQPHEMDCIKMPTKKLFKNMPRLLCDPIPQRTYEIGEWYYLVFKPYNGTYDPEYNALDYIRKFLSKSNLVNCYVITRERISSKIHWNVLVNCTKDLMIYHDHPTQKFFIHAQVCPKPCDRSKVYDYITKEYYVNHLEWNRRLDYEYKM